MNTIKSLNAVKYTIKTINEIFDYLQSRELPANLKNESSKYRFKRKANQFIIQDGKLFHAGLQVIPEEEVNDTLKSMYDDSAIAGGLIGRDKWYDKVKEKYIGITKQDILKFLDNQESYQLNKPYIKNKIVKPIISTRKNQRWAMDLMVLIKQSNQNNGYQYILAVIDTFSKFVWAVGLKEKGAKTVADALEDIILISGSSPKLLQSDNGSEFKNKEMDKVIERFNIKQIFSQPYSPQSNGIIENWNKYAKNALRLHFIKTDKKRWIDELNQIVYNWNTSKHGITQETPSDIAETDDIEILSEVRNRIKDNAQKILNTQAKLPPLEIGQFVRVSKFTTRDGRRDKWEKMNSNWSKEIYKIVNITEDTNYKRARYTLEKENGEAVKKQYYRDDLQLIDKNSLVEDAGTKKNKRIRNKDIQEEQKIEIEQIDNKPVSRSTRLQKKKLKDTTTESIAQQINKSTNIKKLVSNIPKDAKILDNEPTASRTRSKKKVVIIEEKTRK